MKRTTLLALALALGSFLIPTVQAQEPAAPSTNAPAARPTVRTRTDVLALRLKLTDEQKEKVRPILDAETKQMLEFRTQTNLPAADRRAKMMTIREDTNTKLKAVLTPDQYTLYTRPFQSRMTNAIPATPALPAAPAQ